MFAMLTSRVRLDEWCVTGEYQSVLSTTAGARASAVGSPRPSRHRPCHHRFIRPRNDGVSGNAVSPNH